MLLLAWSCAGPPGVSSSPDTAEVVDGPVGSGRDSDAPDPTPGDSQAPDTGESAAPVDTSVLWGEAPLPADPYAPGVPDVVVDCNGGGDFTTIAEAVRASTSGTRVGLAPCTYVENVDFLGKSLDVFGLGDPAEVVIQGDGSRAVVTMRRGEGPGTRLAGLTVSGGGGERASALDLLGVVVTVEHVVLAGNHGAESVVSAEGVALSLADVRVHDNTVAADGALFKLDNGSVVAERLDVDCGDAPVGIDNHTSLLLRSSTSSCPRSRVALSVDGGELQARQTRVDGGTIGILATDRADNPSERLWLYNTIVTGGAVAVLAAFVRVDVDQSVFWGGAQGLALGSVHDESRVHNTAILGGSCPLLVAGATVEVAWPALGDGGACGVDVISPVVGDPRFANAPEDFHLRANSPLVNAGNPGEEDADGSRRDVGAFGGPNGSW